MYELILQVINDGIPVTSTVTDYELSLSDNGHCIYVTGDKKTVYIPNTIFFPVGIKINILCGYVTNYIYLAALDTTTQLICKGYKTDYIFGLNPNSLLTIIKVDTNIWSLSGTTVIPRQNMTNLLTGYYKTLTSNEITNISDTDVTIYNVYLNYSNFYYKDSLQSMTSYYTYTYDNTTTTVDDTITFLINTGVSSESDTQFPFNKENGVFCLPLISIPSTATDISFGYQITTNRGVYTYSIGLALLSTLNVHIFDATTGNLPLATASTSSITVATGSFTVDYLRTLLLTTLDSSLALYQTTNYTSTYSTFTKGLILMTSFTPETTLATTGKWFSTSNTPAYYISDESTPYLLLTTKINNYSVSGLNTSSTYSASYTVTPTANSSIEVSFNAFPVHPYGTFPTVSTQVAGLCDSNNNYILPYTENMSFTVTASKTTTNDGNNPLTMGCIGYIFDNIPLYAGMDATGYNPVAFECGDIFGGYPSSTDYHRHIISPPILNWLVDNEIRVVGFMIDGYPIVSPFLITVNSVTRVIETADLNINHGIVDTITFTINNVELTYDFYYVATFDFPYTIASFYGTPVTLV